MPIDAGLILDQYNQSRQRKDTLKERERQYTMQQADLELSRLREKSNLEYQKAQVQHWDTVAKETERSHKENEDRKRDEDEQKKHDSEAKSSLQVELAKDKRLTGLQQTFIKQFAQTSPDFETYVRNLKAVGVDVGELLMNQPVASKGAVMPGLPLPQNLPQVLQGSTLAGSQPDFGNIGASIKLKQEKAAEAKAKTEEIQRMTDANEALKKAQTRLASATAGLTEEKKKYYAKESDALYRERIANADYHKAASDAMGALSELRHAQTESVKLRNEVLKDERKFFQDYGTKPLDPNGKARLYGLVQRAESHRLSLRKQRDTIRKELGYFAQVEKAHPVPPGDPKTRQPNVYDPEWAKYDAAVAQWQELVKSNESRASEEENTLSIIESDLTEADSQIREYKRVGNVNGMVFSTDDDGQPEKQNNIGAYGSIGRDLPPAKVTPPPGMPPPGTRGDYAKPKQQSKPAQKTMPKKGSGKAPKAMSTADILKELGQ